MLGVYWGYVGVMLGIFGGYLGICCRYVGVHGMIWRLYRGYYGHPPPSALPKAPARLKAKKF